MNKSYLNSVNNTAFSLKPSRAIYLLLMVLFVGLFGNIETAKAAVRTASVTGNWNDTATWGGNSAPLAGDTVIINSGIQVTVTANAVASNVSIMAPGILTIENNVILTVYGNVDVATGAEFNAGTGNSDSATILVYGDFTNNGKADFWKSTVVIAGNLYTASTILQNNGDIIVGGNITGTVTGSGTGVVYPVNSNATVSLTTGSSVTVKPLGTLPTDSTMLSYINQVIYGGSCSLSITDPVNVVTWSGCNASFAATAPSGSTFQWQINTGSGWASTGVTTSTYSLTGVTTSMNNYRYRAVITSGSCTKNGDYASLFVTALTTPVVTTTQPTCSVSTGAIKITAPIGTGITYSIDGTTYTNTTGVFSLISPGTYNISAKSPSGCISPTTSITIKSATNVWNGSVWSNGSVPISTENIEFAGNYSSSSDLSGCSCKVTAGAVVINSPHTLTITNAVSVLGGSLTFKHDLNVPSNSASLVQKNNVTNSGNIIYERMTNTLVRNTDYTYWSSPVSSQTLYNLSPFTLSGMLYSYEVTATSEDWKQEIGATTMAVGKGYAVRGPENKGLNLFLASFNGVPNNGRYALTGIFADKSYLLGNPYPSAINADTFLSENAGVLDGTLYFWTHNTKQDVGVSNPGSGTLAYSSDDYASYNVTGGVGVGTGNFASADEQTYNKPTGKIAAGQGFFASTKVAITGTNEIVFNNDMRVAGTSGNNSQFFKTKNPNGKTAKAIEKNRVWLNLANAEGAFKQTLVGYITDATNEYDSRFDGESFDGNEFVDFYSINQDKNLVIQGRALPFDENDEVPLGYRTTIDGTFTINIDQVDGTLTNQAMFLEDKLTNTIFDLKSGNYTFNTVAGTFDDRFVLRYVDKVNTDKTLGLNETDVNDGIIVLYSNNYKTLIIKNNVQDATVNSVTLYNMLGQKITDWDVKDREQTSIQIPIKNVSPEMYIVKVKTTKGEASKKIVVR